MSSQSITFPSNLSKTLSRLQFDTKKNIYYSLIDHKNINNNPKNSSFISLTSPFTKQLKTMRQHNNNNKNKNKSCYIQNNNKMILSTETEIVNNYCQNQNTYEEGQYKCNDEAKINANGNTVSVRTEKHNKENNNKGNNVNKINMNKMNSNTNSHSCDKHRYKQQRSQSTINVRNNHISNNIKHNNIIKKSNQQQKLHTNFTQQLYPITQSQPPVQFTTLSSSINPLRLKILQSSVKQQFLYKNKQLTKILAQFHKFVISIQQIKWIVNEVCELMKKCKENVVGYDNMNRNGGRNNDQIILQDDRYKYKAEIQNMLIQAQHLKRRFYQLQFMKETYYHSNFHFNHNNNDLNYMLNNIKLSQRHQQNQNQSINQINKISSSSPVIKSSIHPINTSPHQYTSWSRLIQNIQNQRQRQHLNIDNDNLDKNMLINTFKIAQNNQYQQNNQISPYKNKTLNQLIKLSQFRKCQNNQNSFMNNDDNNKENVMNNMNNMNTYQNKNNKVKESNVIMKKKMKKNNNNNNNRIVEQHSSNNNESNIITKNMQQQQQQQQQNYDPFDFVHLNNHNNQNKTNTIYHNNPSNPNPKQYQYISKLRTKIQSLQCQRSLLQQQFSTCKKNYEKYQVYVNAVVEKVVAVGNGFKKNIKNNKNINNDMVYEEIDGFVSQLYRILQNVIQSSDDMFMVQENQHNRYDTNMADFGNFNKTAQEKQLLALKYNILLEKQQLQQIKNKKHHIQSNIQMLKRQIQKQIQKLEKIGQNNMKNQKINQNKYEYSQNNHNNHNNQNKYENNGGINMNKNMRNCQYQYNTQYKDKDKQNDMHNMLVIQAYTIEEMIMAMDG